MRRGNLDKMRKLAEEVKARARIGQDIIGEKKAAAAAPPTAVRAASVHLPTEPHLTAAPTATLAAASC